MAIFDLQTETECLYSTVRNISATEKFFGFLPPHGRRLGCGEEMTIWGDIQTWLTRFTPNARARRGLEEALSGVDSNGDPTTAGAVLALVKTPSVFLYDDTLDLTNIINLDSGTLGIANPCWGAYSSSVAIECTDDSGGQEQLH